MKKSMSPPVYSQVAFDIASKIAAGDIKENTKFTGRSLMSTQYNVSQETIRRAFKLLSDMGIISIQQNVGATAISKSKAIEYIQKFQTGKDISTLKQELKKLLDERNTIDERVVEIINQITDLNDRFKSSDPLRNYEFEILPTSSIVGKSIGEVGFWQNTGATIVGIRSEGEIILSPGPHAIFKPYDILVVAGAPDTVEKVVEFIK